MKQGIHPKYYKTKVVCTSCGSEFETGSTPAPTAILSIQEDRDSHRLRDV